MGYADSRERTNDELEAIQQTLEVIARMLAYCSPLGLTQNDHLDRLDWISRRDER